MSDLPQILDLRIPYLDPSFECMVSSLSLLVIVCHVNSFLNKIQVRMQSHFAADSCPFNSIL